ncbi:NADPH-dependent FMN reductase, partial [Vibrio genomosp. F10 str. 9ZD137]
VLAAATGSAPYFGGNVVASVSVPNFYENFDVGTDAITNDDIVAQLKDAVSKLS